MPLHIDNAKKYFSPLCVPHFHRLLLLYVWKGQETEAFINVSCYRWTWETVFRRPSVVGRWLQERNARNIPVRLPPPEENRGMDWRERDLIEIMSHFRFLFWCVVPANKLLERSEKLVPDLSSQFYVPHFSNYSWFHHSNNIATVLLGI